MFIQIGVDGVSEWINLLLKTKKLLSRVVGCALVEASNKTELDCLLKKQKDADDH